MKHRTLSAILAACFAVSPLAAAGDPSAEAIALTYGAAATALAPQGGGGEDPQGSLKPVHKGNHQTMELALVPKTARPGEVVTVEVRVSMEAGWHNYGSMQDKTSGQPSTMKVAENPAFTVVGAAEVPPGNPHVVVGDPYYFLEGDWVMSQQIRIPASATPGATEVRVALSYMACDDAMCDAPVATAVGTTLTVEAGDARPKYTPAPAPAEKELPASIHKGNHQEMEVVLVPATARPGEVVTVEIRTRMDLGWHNYGASQDATLGQPTTMAVVPAPGFTPVGPAVVPPGHPSEIVGETYYFLEGDWVMTQQILVDAKAAAGILPVVVDFAYMACDDSMCDASVATAVGTTLKVEAGDARPEYIPAAAPTPAAAPAQDDLPASIHKGNHQEMEVVLVPATARAGELVTVEIRTRMEMGWHNYGASQNPTLGQPTTMAVVPAPGFTPVGPAVVPPGHPSEIVGETYHFLEGDWVMTQQIRVDAKAAAGTLPVVVDLAYMACDDGTCDDPVATKVGAALKIEAGAARPEFATAKAQTEAPKGDGTSTPKVGEREDLNQLSLWLYLMGAVGAGLFALVMPCTYPMIPLTISFFTKQAEKKGGQPVFLALIFGGGIIASFLVLGGLLGTVMQDVATNPWLNFGFGLAFVFFALTLFGVVDLRPPQFLMNSATKAQMMASGSTSSLGMVVPVFLMGLTLCITSFACTAPFLGSMIAAGVNSGGQSRLFLGMGVFGLTMALPFVALSLVPGRLPKGGTWMVSAKILFAFVELAAALKFFSNAEYSWDMLILPREVFLVIWAALFAVAGFYMLGLVKLKGETGEIGNGRLLTGSAVLALAAYFALGATGYRLDNAVMTAFEPPYSSGGGHGLGETGSAKKSHKIIVDDFDGAVELARASDKLLLVNFTGLN